MRPQGILLEGLRTRKIWLDRRALRLVERRRLSLDAHRTKRKDEDEKDGVGWGGVAGESRHVAQ